MGILILTYVQFLIVRPNLGRETAPKNAFATRVLCPR